jgi:hypothetical protein
MRVAPARFMAPANDFALWRLWPEGESNFTTRSVPSDFTTFTVQNADFIFYPFCQGSKDLTRRILLEDPLKPQGKSGSNIITIVTNIGDK